MMLSMEDPQGAASGGLSYGEDTQGLVPNFKPEDATRKAGRVIESLSEDDKKLVNPAQVEEHFRSGQEDILADALAKSEDAKRMSIRTEMLTSLAQQKSANGGGPLTPAEMSIINSLSNQEIKTNPYAVVEKKFGQYVANQTAALNQDKYEKALEQNPDRTDQVTSAQEEYMARQEVVRTQLEKARKRTEDQSWGGYLVDFGKNFIPLYDVYNRYKFDGDVGLTRSVIQAQRHYLLSLPTVEQFKAELERGYETMAQDNPQQAEQWLHEIFNGTSDDLALASFFNVLDVAGTAAGAVESIGKIPARARLLKSTAIDAVDTYKNVAKSVVKAAGKADIKKDELLLAAGNQLDAASLKAVRVKTLEEEIKAKNSTVADAKAAELLSAKAPALHDPKAIFDVDVPTRINNEFVRRFIEQSNRFVEKSARALIDLPKIGRLDEGSQALTSAVDSTVEVIRKLYPDVRHAIIGEKFVPASDTISNVGFVDVHIGRPSGELFDSEDALHTTVQKYYGIDKNSYRVEDHGGKYFAVIRKDVDEGLRNITIEAKNATPVSTWSWIPKRFGMSADASLSKSQNEVRKVLVAASQEYQRVYQQLSEPLQALSKRERNRVSRILEQHRDFMNTDGVRGKWANTINEFDEDFIKLHGQAPSDRERLAYFNYRQLSDLDYMVRNLDLYRNRASKGIEDWRFKINGVETDKIQGRYVETLPWDATEDFRFIMVEQDGTSRTLLNRDLSPSERDRIKTLIENNHRQVVQIARPVEQNAEIAAYLPENMRTTDPINFIVSTRPQRTPLSHQQIPYKAGGHVVNDVRWFVKNANIVQKNYFGDLTFSGHVTEREAQEFARTLEEGRQLYKAEKLAGKSANKQILDDWAAKNLPMTGGEFRAHFFRGSLNENGPIMVMKDGMRGGDLLDLRTQGLRDYTKSQFNIDDSMDKAFTKEKGEALYNFAKASPGNPTWRMQTARTLNPVDSLNEALRSAIQSRLHTDYVIRSANEFVDQFHNLMAVDIETMKRNPVYWLYHPQWRQDKKAYDADQTAKVIRRTVETTIPARARQTDFKGYYGKNQTTGQERFVDINVDNAKKIYGGQTKYAQVYGDPKNHTHLQDLQGNLHQNTRRLPVPDWFADAIKTADELTAKLDLPNVKLWYSDHAHNARGVFYNDKYIDPNGDEFYVPTIVIGRHMTREEAVRVLAHELGHHADWNALRTASQGTRDAVKKAYERWLKTLNDNTPMAHIRTGNWNYGGSNLGDQSIGHRAYLTNFEEWFAEETSKWLLTRKKPMGVVEKFFEGLAARWKEIYQKILGKKQPPVPGEVASFLKGQWREDKVIRKELLETIYPPPPRSDQTLQATNAAKTMREAVISLIETPSDVKVAWDAVKNRILNSVYEKYGAERAQWLDEMGLFKTNDPVRFARSIAFHTKIGLFNPVQLFLNAQTMFHAAAIAPSHALPAFRDANILFYRLHTPSPAIKAKFRSMSTYKHYDELEKLIEDSGVSIVGGGHANLDDFLEPKMIQSAFGKFLDTGTVFFRTSEQMVRLNATTIAHREWRKANPLARLDDNGKRWILNRADALSVNMTRASNAWYQRGFGSIPFQFTSYATRMSEQILSGLMGSAHAQLTRGEAARVMGAYSLLYGVPTGAAAALGIFPIQEMFKEHAERNGYDLNANLAARTFSFGVLNLIADYAVGQDTNLSERYGPNGTTILSDLTMFGGDKGIEAALGASGSILGDLITKTVPIMGRTADLFSNADNARPLVFEDLLDAARSISTVDNATKAYMALKWGQFITKNEVAMTDVNGLHAVTMALLGLTPREVTDNYTDRRIMQDSAKAQQQITREVIKEIQRAYRSYEDGDSKMGDKFFQRAKALIQSGDFNPQQQSAIFAQALSSYKGDIENTNLKMLRNAPNADIFNRRLEKLSKESN